MSGLAHRISGFTPIRLIRVFLNAAIVLGIIDAMLFFCLHLGSTTQMKYFLATVGVSYALMLVFVFCDVFLPDRWAWWKDPLTGEVERWGS